MEFLKISDSTIKITLEPKEATEYMMNEESDLTNEETKELFKMLLSRAKKEVGFGFAGGRVVAEIFNSKNGGCEIFVSRMGDKGNVNKEKGTADGKRLRISQAVYSFESIDRLLMAVYRLKMAEYKGRSAVYYDTQRKRYYITLEDVSIKDLKYAFLGEYARLMKYNFSFLIKEHFKCICKKDAVSVLSALV